MTGQPTAAAATDRRSRRLFALIVAAVIAVAASVPAALAGRGGTSAQVAAAAANQAGQTRPLRELASRLHRWIGTAVDTKALARDHGYASVLASQFSSVTAENAMKWEVVEPRRGKPDYSAADQLVAFARRNHQIVRGHNLVWHSQLPSWLTGGAFTKTQLARILQRHISGEVSHFRGRVYAWDVVNEPLDESGGLRDTLWLDALGPDYIAKALEWAHKADPKAKLYLNDYGIEGSTPKADAMLALVKKLLARHVPINGVGFESHLDIQYGFPSGMAANMQRFARLGLDVAVTEADVRVPLPATHDQLETQASYYRQLIGACLGVKRCVSFTVWGFSDRYSWIPKWFPGEGAADLYDRNLKPKPAYGAIHDALATAKP
jgi:endo-1,4-beta-xylanase